MATMNMEFRYVAQNSKGTKIKGVIEATSEARAYSQLKAQGLVPMSVKPAASGMQKEFSIPGVQKRVKVKPLSVFAKQFGTLLKAGMPLVRALQVVTSQTENPTLKKALQAVLADVEGGATLATAMAKQPQAFPVLMTSLVRVGEGGGFLDKTLESVAVNMQAEVELRGKVKGAMMYPLIVGTIAILAVAMMLIFVVPVFEEMFKSMGASLPAPTQLLINLSKNMSWIAPAFIVGVGGGLFVYRKNKNKENVRKTVDTMKLKAPVFGNLNRKVSIARFTRNLAMMIDAGVPLLNALDLSSSASNNWVMEDALDGVMEEMKKGKSFAQPLTQYPVFPSIVTQMIAVGEESGTLAQMLDSIADFYEEEVKLATEALSAAMEPFMIMFLGGMVGGMVVALYMPMFSLFKTLSAASE